MRHAARDEAAGPAAALRPAGARRVPARPFPPAAKWYLLYGLALIALWISGVQAWWASQDAANFHIPQIRLILEQGAWRAFLQPIVAMPIGFHLAAAGLHAATGIDAALAGRLLSLLCMVAGAAFTWGLSRRFGERAQLVNLMVLLLSWPLWSASMSSVTDTMGFALFALFALCVAEERHIAAGASLGALVLVRQYYAAPALALVASALWGWLRAAHHGADQSSRTEGPRGPSPWATGLAAVPALLCLGLLHVAWGALVPPKFQGMYQSSGINWGGATLVLAWSGVIGAAARAMGVRWIPERKGWFYASMLGALALMLALPTTWDMAQGRWGGVIWHTARLTSIGGRSYVVVALGAFGASFILRVVLAALESGKPAALVLAFSGLGFVAELLLQPFAWQRYVDPMLGFCLINSYFFSCPRLRTPWNHSPGAAG